MTTIVKTFTCRNRNFVIVRNDNGYYLAIEDKYITDGKMNTTLNGLQMSASTDLEQTLRTTRERVEVDYLMEHGKTKAEAFAKVWNIPTEAVERMFEA